MGKQGDKTGVAPGKGSAKVDIDSIAPVAINDVSTYDFIPRTRRVLTTMVKICRMSLMLCYSLCKVSRGMRKQR